MIVGGLQPHPHFPHLSSCCSWQCCIGLHFIFEIPDGFKELCLRLSTINITFSSLRYLPPLILKKSLRLILNHAILHVLAYYIMQLIVHCPSCTRMTIAISWVNILYRNNSPSKQCSEKPRAQVLCCVAYDHPLVIWCDFPHHEHECLIIFIFLQYCLYDSLSVIVCMSDTHPQRNVQERMSL